MSLKQCRHAALLALATLILACSGRAIADCLDCHRGIESIATGKMQQDLQRLGAKYDDPEGCVICHGGDPKSGEVSRAHQGAPAKLAQAGGPQAFHPDPGAPEIVDRTCGQCHKGYAARWLKSSMSTETGIIERDLCEPAWRKRRARSALEPTHFGRYPVLDDDGFEPAVGSSLYRTWMRRQIEAAPHQYPSRLLAVPLAPWPAEGPHPTDNCAVCHGQSAKTPPRPGCSACHIRRGLYAGMDPTIPRDKETTPRLHRIQGKGRTYFKRPDATAVGWLGIALETCFACHFDPRAAARNPTGEAMAHYGHHREDAPAGLWCQDCHTSIEMHGDGNIPATSAAQLEVSCEDCHGTLEKLPWELPLAAFGPNGETPAPQVPRGLINTEGKAVDGSDLDRPGGLLTSRGNPFGNVFRENGRVYLRSVSGRLHQVSLLATLGATDGWRSALGRQIKSSPELHQKMDCMDCHADWLPACLECHADDQELVR